MAIDLKAFKTPEEQKVGKSDGKSSGGVGALLQRDIQLFGNKLSLKEKEALFSELSVLLMAGLDIQKSLDVIKQNKKRSRKKELIADIQQRIIQGAAMSEAMKETGKFSEYEIYSIQIGEESGQLVRVLEELARFYKKSMKYRQQLISALTYPAFVIGFAFIVVFFLLKYLVPMFSDIYKRFDGDLPLITQKLVSLSGWMQANALFVVAIVTGISLFFYIKRSTSWYKKGSAFLALRIPLFGEIIRKIYLARFSQSMFLLLSAKVPLLRAVELIEKMIDFYPVSKSLQVAKSDILQGVLLHKTLSTHGFFPASFIALLQVGEESGKLDAMFQKLSEQNTEAVEQKTALIGSLIEPILIISLGAIVGLILVAMYMPLFQMSVGVGR